MANHKLEVIVTHLTGNYLSMQAQARLTSAA